MGASRLGQIGSTIGWILVMFLMAVIANLWGLPTSEWRGAGRKPFRVMSAGLAIPVVAMFLVG